LKEIEVCNMFVQKIQDIICSDWEKVLGLLKP